MDISGGLLAGEIHSIANRKTDFKRSYTATILAGPEEINVLSVTRLDIASDFEKAYRDSITITVLLPLGTILEKIAPYQDDIVILLKETIVNEYDFRETEYKAYLMEDLPNDIERSSTGAFRDIDKSNLLTNVNISFSLVLPIVEYMDAIHTGTVVREVPPFSVLKVLFNKYMESINLALDEGIESITMVEPSNYNPRSQIIIPHNTRLIKLPDLLQNEMGGIYSSGLGFFLSRRALHFWPLYDVERNEEIKNRLHIYVTPSKHSVVLDNTYKIEGGLVSILTSSKPKVFDDTLGQTYREGDSLRYVDGDMAFKPLGEVKNSTITASRTSRNIETTTVSTGKRINSISGDSTVITSNIYKEMSKKAKMDGLYITFQWRASNHYLIKPGMLTTIFMVDDNIGSKEVPGIVVSIYTKYELETRGVNNKTLLSVSVVTVFVNRGDWRMDKFLDSGLQRSSATTK